jgi:hypothetical protein
MQIGSVVICAADRACWSSRPAAGGSGVERTRGGVHMRVRWARIDRALAPFAASSLVPLLSAAIDSPFLGAVRPQLWLVWIRALRRPPTGTRPAGLADLDGLVAGGFAADPRGLFSLWEPADPRTVVRYRCGRARFRVHPGDLEHPLLFLRSVSTVARGLSIPGWSSSPGSASAMSWS